MGESEAAAARPCSCKVEAVASEFGLDGIHEELCREWADDDGMSVRELADMFNKRVLRTACRRADKLPIDGEIANLYRVLTDDGTDAGGRTRAREQLRQDGIPIADVEERFISHQTLYRHLVNCLDRAHEPPRKTDEERIEEWRSRLRALQNRTTSVTERGIEQLSNHGAVDIGSFDVLLEVNVMCEDCGGFYTLGEFLDAETCECLRSDESA